MADVSNPSPSPRMGAHTKGPIEFGRDDDGRGVIFLNSGIGNHLAYLSNGGVPEDQEEANGYLFAAAAALYEALRQCQSALAMMIAPDAVKQTTVVNAYAAATAAEAAARAALSKAEERG